MVNMYGILSESANVISQDIPDERLRIDDVRGTVKSWGKMTFREMLDAHKDDFSPHLLERIKGVLERSNKFDSQVNGDISRVPKDLVYEQDGLNIQFVVFYNQTKYLCNSCNVNFDPVAYLAVTIDELEHRISFLAIEHNEKDAMAKFCNRALRALPSFLREDDLEEKVREAGCEVYSSNKLDTNYKADLAYVYKGHAAQIWSFTDTRQAFDCVIQKLCGEHGGEIADGVHRFQPNHCNSYNSDNFQDINGFRFLSSNDISSVINIIKDIDKPRVELLGGKYFQFYIGTEENGRFESHDGKTFVKGDIPLSVAKDKIYYLLSWTEAEELVKAGKKVIFASNPKVPVTLEDLDRARNKEKNNGVLQEIGRLRRGSGQSQQEFDIPELA